MRRKTVLNILLILLVLAFFVTPLGYQGKLLLNRIFSFSPSVIPVSQRTTISDYDWKLKDANWEIFNFERSKGKVVFLNFWASWRLPCAAELRSVEVLYNKYKDRADFYIITDEEREPVLEFMEEHNFNFPVTYLIIGEDYPLDPSDPPRSYIIGKKGGVAVDQHGIADWDNTTVYGLLDELIAEKL